MAKDILRKPGGFMDTFVYKPGHDKKNTHYCPGCGHGILHKLIAEALEDLGVADRTIMISPVGCSVFVYYYFATGNIQVAHGRAPAVATGLKRANPDSIVISYQGDGDLAAIGGNNILQAANRGENITVFFVNNAIYGMTGGQMAPTTLVGQKTMTSPYGRSVENEGHPIKIVELLNALESPAYLERTTLEDSKNIAKTRKAVRKAIQCQIDGKGFSLVEVLAMCPSQWRVSPVESKKWITDNMVPYFTPGVKRDVIDEREGYYPERPEIGSETILELLGLRKEKLFRDRSMSDVPEKYRNPQIKVAGFGGQGVLLLGQTLAEAGMRYGWNVSWIPSYGPEMRGGTANCQVNISEGPIGSPVVDFPTILVALNKPSLDKFEESVQPGGIIFYNTSMIDRKPARTDVEVIGVPFSEIADELGNLRFANMVVVGSILAKTKLIEMDIVKDALAEVIHHKKFIEPNIVAIERGASAV
ncbi:MAG TPA: 2-ketoisovalerate ferredoxin oxidoreductase [candidate division Zixibacteria bacterium]|nr:2-ketoisovalerate ferredoxin oxidoreductase [candidate division Zixibacteria bacterium]